MTFGKTGNTETGLQFENIISSPDLKMGTTLAIFSLSGNIPVTKDKLQMWESGEAIEFRTDLTTVGFNSSQPAALSLKLDMILSTSSSVTGSRYSSLTMPCLR